MDTQLRDEAAQDRVRAAKEFLDPSKSYHSAATESCFLICCFFFSSQPITAHGGSSICDLYEHLGEFRSDKMNQLPSRYYGDAQSWFAPFGRMFLVTPLAMGEWVTDVCRLTSMNFANITERWLMGRWNSLIFRTSHDVFGSDDTLKQTSHISLRIHTILRCSLERRREACDAGKERVGGRSSMS
jgi:hypothetical protein